MSDAIRTLMFPEIAVKLCGIAAELFVDRAVRKDIVRRKDRGIIAGVLVKRIDDGLIWRDVADVVKIEHGDVLAAQKIQKLFGVFLVCAVSRNEPGIDPEVGSLLRNRVGEIGVGLYGGGCLAGVDER